MHVCNECGARAPRWQGRCSRCGAWGSLEAEPEPPRARAGPAAGGRERAARRARGREAPDPLPLAQVPTGREAREATGLEEFDRVLGGGLVPGSVVLVGGEPGVGKSTLLLRVAALVAAASPSTGGPRAGGTAGVLYVTGEESPRQVALRAARIGATGDSLALLDTADTDAVVDALERHRPRLCVVDSVQSVRSGDCVGAPGGPTQVRAAAERLVPAARATGSALLLVGQVTKVGGLAGPRTLEHAVDTVVLFEGDRHTSLRALRAIKNRFGPTDEIGLFEMREDGLREVRNASDRLLADRGSAGPGSVVAPVVEGRRAMCVEVQALLVGRNVHGPRRRAQGVDPRRIELLAGVVASRLESELSHREAFVNVVGGLTIQDTGLDLAVAIALIGEQRGTTIERDAVVMGEVGLRGEVRPVTRALARLKEARAMGFRRAYVPRGTPALDGIEVLPVGRVSQVPLFGPPPHGWDRGAGGAADREREGAELPSTAPGEGPPGPAQGSRAAPPGVGSRWPGGTVGGGPGPPGSGAPR